MKNLFYLSLILCCLSCKKDTISHKSEFDASLNQWNNYKASISNKYMYTTTTSSFTGISTSTIIAVENGVVTLRWYTVYTNNNGTVNIAKTWTENNATLNTHQEGAPAITIDDIYARAKNEWLTADKTKNDITFQTDANGIIKSCGFVPKGCQDDCFTGVNIKLIERMQ